MTTSAMTTIARLVSSLYTEAQSRVDGLWPIPCLMNTTTITMITGPVSSLRAKAQNRAKLETNFKR